MLGVQLEAGTSSMGAGICGKEAIVIAGNERQWSKKQTLACKARELKTAPTCCLVWSVASCTLLSDSEDSVG